MIRSLDWMLGLRGAGWMALSLGVALAACVEAAPGPAVAPRIAIVGGRVHTMTGRTYDPGRVLIEGETITAVGGTEVDVPSHCEVVDAAGAWVVPGLIDSGTGLGLLEVELEDATRDNDESTELFSPQLRVVDAINPQSELIRVSRLTGVTTVLVAPGEANLFSGQAAIIDLAGGTIEEMTVRAPAMLCLNLGTDAISRGRSRSRFATRMGLVAEIRDQFFKARDFIKKQEKYQRQLKEYQEELVRFEAQSAKPSAESTHPATAVAAVPASAAAAAGKSKRPEQPDEPARDLKMEALVQMLKGEVPLLVRAQREDDIRAAVRLADEFKLKIVLKCATEGWKLAELLAKKEIPVIVGPINQQPDTFETLAARYENADILRRAGVSICIQSAETHNVRNLPYTAGLAAAHGLSPEEALEAITIGAAKILGISDRYGSLEKGKIANIAVVEGDPLQPSSKLRKLFIRGKSVGLTSRQTELFEKYGK